MKQITWMLLALVFGDRWMARIDKENIHHIL